MSEQKDRFDFFSETVCIYVECRWIVPCGSYPAISQRICLENLPCNRAATGLGGWTVGYLRATVTSM